MALLFHDSFDGFDPSLDGRYSVIAGAPAQVGPGRTGTFGGRMTSANNAKLQQSFSARATLQLGAAIEFTTSTAVSVAGKIFEILDGATSQIYVRVNTDKTLSVVRGDGTVLGTSTATQVLSTAWQYVQFWATIHNTAGAFSLDVDGVTWLSGSGVNTRNSASNQGTDTSLTWTGTGPAVLFDDFYIADDAVPSAYRAYKVEALLPNAPGNYSQWNGSDGNQVNNNLLVDEGTPNSDTDYVYSTTVGDIDSYAFGNLSGGFSGTIVGVQRTVSARKDDLNVREIAQMYRSGGTDYVGPTITLTGSYDDYWEMLLTDPATSAAWISTGVNAYEGGVKVIT